MLAYFFESVLAAVLQPEAHLDDFLLARAQSLEDFSRLFAQVEINHGFGWRHDPPVNYEIAKMRFFFLADWCFERNRLLSDAQHLAYFADRQLHLHREFFGGRLAAQFLLKLALQPDQFVDRLDHVDRNANSSRLVRNGAGDRLANPPRRIGRELITTAIIELIDRLH